MIEAILITVAVILWIICTISLFLLGAWAATGAFDEWKQRALRFHRSKWVFVAMMTFSITLFCLAIASGLLGIAIIYGG